MEKRRISAYQPFLSFFLLLAGMTSKTMAQQNTSPLAGLPQDRVNIGVKAGFNSSLYFTNRFFIGEGEVTGAQTNYKVGCNASIFMRINFKGPHFIQTEVACSSSKGSLSISKNVQNSEFLADNALIRSNTTTIDIPFLYGYKFIDTPPYGMAFFIGPQVSRVWETQSSNEYSGFYQQNIEELIYPFNFSLVAGIAVNISNIFFDFRYNAGLHSITRALTYDHAATLAPYNDLDISIKRRKDILNFSVGIIF